MLPTMFKARTLTALSAIALFASLPAHAETAIKVSGQAEVSKPAPGNNPTTPELPTVTEQDLERGWDKTKDAVSETAESTARAVESAYEDVKAALIDSKSKTEKLSYITINPAMTAKVMIGADIHDTNGKTIGNVDDILVDEKGAAKSIIVSHGGFLGLGTKEAALDYGMVMRKSTNGDLIVPVTEQSLKQAKPFSYDRADAQKDPGIQTIPSGQMRVSALLDSTLVNAKGKKVAAVDNIYFMDGMASRLLASFDETLGMGGELAAMEYNELSLHSKDGQHQFKMSAAQSTRFEQFEKQATN
ncbi:MAG: PRC-barrel domain-containing protein [Rhodospirillales bacterium]|nr:PRC-barrel domain-containing protein [Rhodospirillales bacterium]